MAVATQEIYALDERGNITVTDLDTGETRTEVTSQTDPLILDMENLRKVYTEEGDLVYVPRNISLDNLDKIQGKRRAFPYSPLLADRICEEVANGKSLVAVSKMLGMPNYSEIARWRRQHPDFDKAYREARNDRAEVYFDKIMTEVENARADRDEIALARLKTDIYKFAAKVCAPDDYAEKTTLDAKVAVGVFSIETGIRRDGDPGFNIDETKALQVEEGVSNSDE